MNIRIVTGCPCGADIIELVSEDGRTLLSGFEDNAEGRLLFARVAECSIDDIVNAPRVSYEERAS